MKSVLKKRVSFHETDCMGVVHHSVYAKFFEEARVEWLYSSGLAAFHAPAADFVLAVLDLQIKYLRPLRVGDEFEVFIAYELQGSKLHFEYELFLGDIKTTEGQSLHIGLNSELKVVKPPRELLEGLKALL